MGFHRVLRFSPASIIPPMFSPHSFVYHPCYTILATDSVFKQYTERKETWNSRQLFKKLLPTSQKTLCFCYKDKQVNLLKPSGNFTYEQV
jgi:hypothetical protein